MGNGRTEKYFDLDGVKNKKNKISTKKKQAKLPFVISFHF